MAKSHAERYAILIAALVHVDCNCGRLALANGLDANGSKAPMPIAAFGGPACYTLIEGISRRQTSASAERKAEVLRKAVQVNPNSEVLRLAMLAALDVR